MNNNLFRKKELSTSAGCLYKEYVGVREYCVEVCVEVCADREQSGLHTSGKNVALKHCINRNIDGSVFSCRQSSKSLYRLFKSRYQALTRTFLHFRQIKQGESQGETNTSAELQPIAENVAHRCISATMGLVNFVSQHMSY